MSNEQTARLMLKLEALIHREGWDQPPQLRTVRRIADRLTLGRAMPVSWQGAQTGAILEAIANQWEEPGFEFVPISLARMPGFYGVLFAYEAWSNKGLSPSEVGNRSLADIVGSTEMRGVFTVDITGAVITVIRHRGEKPTIERMDMLGGRVTDALVRMVKAVAKHLPDDSGVDREALAALYVSSVEEIEARYNAERARQEETS